MGEPSSSVERQSQRRFMSEIDQSPFSGMTSIAAPLEGIGSLMSSVSISNDMEPLGVRERNASRGNREGDGVPHLRRTAHSLIISSLSITPFGREDLPSPTYSRVG